MNSMPVPAAVAASGSKGSQNSFRKGGDHEGASPFQFAAQQIDAAQILN
jgi:hypothetical protein